MLGLWLAILSAFFMKDLRRDINRLSMSILTLGFMLSSSLLILTLSSYVASAERLSLLFALMYGRIILGENQKGRGQHKAKG